MPVSLVSNQSTYASNMDLSATVAAYFDKGKAFDQVFGAIPLLQYFTGKNHVGAQKNLSQKEMVAKGMLELRSGGLNIDFSARIGRNSTVASMQQYDLVNVTPQQGFTTLSIPWKMYGGSISISKHQQLLNADRALRVLDIGREKTEQAVEEMKHIVYLHLWLGNNGTLTTATDAHGVPYYVGTDGTAGTVATVTRSANTWHQNQFSGTGGQTITDTAPSFSANGLKYMFQMCLDCSAGYGIDEIDGIFTDKTTLTYAYLKLQPQQRYTNNDKPDPSFGGVMNFMGVPIIYDSGCPSGRMYFLNSRTWKFIAHREANLVTTGFVESQDQFAEVAKVLWFFNLLCTEPRRNGVISAWAA